MSLFTGLTIVMTYPLAIKMNTYVTDPGDPLLNTWIISWDIRQLLAGNLYRFFDTNIYYPAEKTLAYSEHLFTQALIGLPIMLATRNPVFTYNFVLLFSFITSGFGMYLFAHQLTKNNWGSIAAGIIYAFSPFMFFHLGHMQIISAGGIPLTFLFLTRFVQDRSYKNLTLFTAFYIFQVLANGYYALYLTLFAGVYLLYFLIRHKKDLDLRVIGRLGIFVLVTVTCTGPFFYQYIAVRKQMGFRRNIEFGAKLSSYLSTTPTNIPYGKLTRQIQEPERILFPGIVATGFALFGILSNARKSWKRRNSEKKSEITIGIPIQKLLNGIICLYFGLIAFIHFTGGFDFTVRLRATSLTNPIITLLILIGIRLLISNRFRIRAIKSSLPMNEYILIFSAFLLCSVLFSFGKSGPYVFLYKYIPGFDGLRVASRFHIMTMLSLSVLASFGIKYTIKHVRVFRSSAYLITFIPALILFEYAAFPHPLTKVPVNDKIPAEYKWLASENRDPVILELPLHDSKAGLPYAIEAFRVYYSIYHGRKIVNGYSGYHPPLLLELNRRIKHQPFLQTINDFRALGVEYLVLHSDQFPQGQFENFMNQMAIHKDKVQLKKKFGNAYIYRISNGVGGRISVAENSLSNTKWVDQKNWTVSSNTHPELAKFANDGDPDTRWTSGPQSPGIYFLVDMNHNLLISGINLVLNKHISDYPVGFKIELSDDGNTWQLVASEKDYRPPIRDFLNPRKLYVNAKFKEASAKYIKITLTGKDTDYYWSINEFGVVLKTP